MRKSRFQKVIDKWTRRGGDLYLDLAEEEEPPMLTTADARSVVSALKTIASEEGKVPEDRAKALGILLRFFLADSKPEIVKVFRDEGLSELRRIIGEQSVKNSLEDDDVNLIREIIRRLET
ncbi:MAG: hypothetical protein NUW37_07530 [Planctomycetes bacterium]|nr:hypothetical protein [Planctomycetota bacterium]